MSPPQQRCGWESSTGSADLSKARRCMTSQCEPLASHMSQTCTAHKQTKIADVTSSVRLGFANNCYAQVQEPKGNTNNGISSKRDMSRKDMLRNTTCIVSDQGSQAANSEALESDQRAAHIEAEVGVPFDDGVVPEPACTHAQMCSCHWHCLLHHTARRAVLLCVHLLSGAC